MVRFWSAKKPVAEPEFESQQEKLRRMSAEVVRRYQREVTAELNDPARLSAVYGSAFAAADCRRQCEIVALMAANMLHVPSSDVNIVLPGRQESLASVRRGKIVPVKSSAIEDSFCKHVIATGREFAVDDAPNHALVCDTTFAQEGDIVSYLGVPIASGEGIIVGVLCVHSPEIREWKTADVSLLTQLSFVITRTLMPAKAA